MLFRGRNFTESSAERLEVDPSCSAIFAPSAIRRVSLSRLTQLSNFEREQSRYIARVAAT